ncbi:hypothetical protein IWX49DRAFT_627218 [Phyllosticta citricarpa]
MWTSLSFFAPRRRLTIREPAAVPSLDETTYQFTLLPTTRKIMAPTWESLKEAIRELYLVQNASKEYVMSEMRRLHNFTATEAQYERQLKRWKFRKNLTTRDHITLNGEPVSSKKLKKKASTSGYQTTWDKLQASLQVCDHRSPTPEGIVVCTPPAGPADEPHQIEVFGLSPSHAPRSPSLPVARSIATLWESSTNSTHPGEGRIYPNALQVALVKALMTQKLPDTKSNHLLAKQWVNLCGRKGLPMNISMALKSNSNIHMLQLPQKLPIMPQMEALAGAVAQETLLLNELKLLTNLIMQSGSGIAKIRAAQDLNSETTTFSNLPIEFSIVIISHGAQIEAIKLQAIGVKSIPVDYSTNVTFDRDQCVAQAKELLHHLSKNGLGRFSPLLRFSVSVVAGCADVVKSSLRSAANDLGVRGNKGHEALAIAARLRHTDVVKVLLDAGAPINQDFRCSTAICPPIFWTTKHGHVEIASLLLHHGALTERPFCPHGSRCTKSYHEYYDSFVSTPPTVLQLASAQGDYLMTKTLLLHDASVNSEPVSRTRTSGFTGQFSDLAGLSTFGIASKDRRKKGSSSVLIELLLNDESFASSVDLTVDSAHPEHIQFPLPSAKRESLDPLKAAAFEWGLLLLNVTLEEGPDINGVCPEGLPAFHMMFKNHSRLNKQDYFLEFRQVWTYITTNPDASSELVGTIVAMIYREHMKDFHEKMELSEYLCENGSICDDPKALKRAITHRSSRLVQILTDILTGFASDDPHLEHPALEQAIQEYDKTTLEILLESMPTIRRVCAVTALASACRAKNQALAQLFSDHGWHDDDDDDDSIPRRYQEAINGSTKSMAPILFAEHRMRD